MPLKDREAKLAYQREWYAKNNKRVIAKVKKRKWKLYGGTCLHCGGPTMGQTKGRAARYCSKPECRSFQRTTDWKLRQRRKIRKEKIVSLDELTKAY